MFKNIVLQEIEEFRKYCTIENADEGLFMIMGVIRLFIRLDLISIEFMEYSIDLAFKTHNELSKNKEI